MKGVSVFFVCAAMLLQGCGEPRDRRADLASLVAAERAFSSVSEDRGIRAAFLEYLAEDAVVFRPDPVDGRRWYYDRPETGVLLTWEPVFADVSQDGNFGYTTGPWRLAEKGGGNEPAAFGQYVSLWRRRPGEVWRVAIDVGTTHPKPDGPPSPFCAATGDKWVGGASGGAESGEGPMNMLIRAAGDFCRVCSSEGAVSGHEKYAADDIRLLRTGAFPVIGKGAVLETVRSESGTPSFEMTGSDVSSSGDLGYTYGAIRWMDEGGQPSRGASYLWVWVRSANGAWTIALDISVPWPTPTAGGGD